MNDLGIPGAVVSDAFGLPTLDVPPESWVEAATRARDGGLTFFDWLSAVDELDAGFRVVLHLADLTTRQRLLLRTLVPRPTGACEALVPTSSGPMHDVGAGRRRAHEVGHRNGSVMRPMRGSPEASPWQASCI